MQNAAIEMHWLMVNHVSRLKKAEKPKMLVWRTEFGRGVFFLGKLNKPCGYWFCQKWLLIISKRPKKSSEWCYFNLTPPTDHGTILRRSPLKYNIIIIIYNNIVFKYNKIIIIKYNISPVTPPGLLELTDCPLFSASLTWLHVCVITPREKKCLCDYMKTWWSWLNLLRRFLWFSFLWK